MNLINRISKRIIMKYLMRKGYSYLSAYFVYYELTTDFPMNTQLSFYQKVKAYKKGFFCERIRSYNLKTDSDYYKYIPEILYYKLHPINGRFSQWIDDKLTMKYMLQPFNEYLPKYYYHLEDGKLFRLSDCPTDFGNQILDLVKLIQLVGAVAAKKIAGTKGDGFYKLSYDKNVYYINNKVANYEAFLELLKNMDGYLFIEYLTVCNLLYKINPESANTIRVSVINEEDDPVITASFIRFGTKCSGVVDNISAGGIFCGVNIENGELFRPSQYDDDWNVIDATYHPDTNVKIEGIIPGWEEMVEKLKEISRYLPQLIYLGYDILVTNDGFKIIEINSLQGLQHLQLFYPTRLNESSRKFFDKRLPHPMND